MARGPEGRFWRKVRAAWPGHAQRVEASHGDSEPGTPDVVLSIGFRGGWVELKVWPDNVSVKQLAWHTDATDRGAYCVVLSRISPREVWLGSAERYDSLVRCGKRPKGVHLQAALNGIRCALISSPK